MKDCIFNPTTHLIFEWHGVKLLIEYTPGWKGGFDDPPENEEFQIGTASIVDRDEFFEQHREAICEAARDHLDGERLRR